MPVDVFAERNAQKDNEDTKYVIVFQSTKSKAKVSLFVKVRKFLGVSDWVTKLREEIRGVATGGNGGVRTPPPFVLDKFFNSFKIG